MNSDRASQNHRETLDPLTWFTSINALHRNLLDDNGDHPARLLRKAFYLTKLIPEPLRGVLATDFSESEFERLSEQDNLDDAVRALLGPALQLQVSKPDGHLKATVEAPTIGVEGTHSDHQYVYAVLGAMIDCVVQIGRLADQDAAINQDPRKSQSGPPLSSTLH